VLEAIGCGLGATFLNLDESGIGLDLLSWAIDLLKRDFVLTPCVGKNGVWGNVIVRRSRHKVTGLQAIWTRLGHSVDYSVKIEGLSPL
jgi:hypothetical protein